MHRETDATQSQVSEKPPPRARPIDLIRYRVSGELVGPPTDPYARTTYSVWMQNGDKRVPSATLIECALTGTVVRIDGFEIPRPKHMDDAKWSFFANWVFEGLTGVRTSDLQEWEAVALETSREVRDAERAAGWDPRP